MPKKTEAVESWQAIAEYFGKEKSTVLRWHHKRPLPIARVGGPGSSVYAFPEDLDDWLKRRKR